MISNPTTTHHDLGMVLEAFAGELAPRFFVKLHLQSMSRNRRSIFDHINARIWEALRYPGILN